MLDEDREMTKMNGKLLFIRFSYTISKQRVLYQLDGINPSIMKKLIFILPLFLVLYSCATSEKTAMNNKNKYSAESDTIRIANDDVEYEIIIIDNGFNRFLQMQPSQDFYTQSVLEQRNQRYVREWNIRAMNPTSYNPQIYEMRIDYDPNIDYGMEVNYLLYQYFQYVIEVYGQNLN